MVTTAWLILFLPFFAFLATILLPERRRNWAFMFSFGSMFGSFLISCFFSWLIFTGRSPAPVVFSFNWIALGQLQIELGILLDSLSLLMLLVVTGVGSAIFYYSKEYMAQDPGFRRYFAGLSLFAFSMIGIVLSVNLLQLFIFWELVGLSSYLLIGHWFMKPEAAEAGKKAFLINRIGDFGFLIGILVLWSLSGTAGNYTLHILRLNEIIPSFGHSELVSAAMFLIFMGVMGKSAQFPLHVWLPDAMEGPTPVSALIHAATMVAAGVYLLARLFLLFEAAPVVLGIISYIGAVTALIAATIAVVQNDIKRILAYSTLSQLGYMVMAVGLGSAAAGMYHLVTHAFFKALLFLSAGSFIHALHDQDIWKMGGLVKRMPQTSTAFLIGSIALAGIWPFSGFFSKDAILAAAAHENQVLFWIGVLVVFLTAFYMGRAIAVALLGTARTEHKAHEPSQQMLLPLFILSVLSLAAGFIGIDEILSDRFHEMHHASAFIVVLSTVLALSGFTAAFLLYRKSAPLPAKIAAVFKPLYVLLNRKYFIDELYDFYVSRIQMPWNRLMNWIESKVIVDFLVNGTARISMSLGDRLRRLQTGRVQLYVSFLLAGFIIIIYFSMIQIRN